MSFEHKYIELFSELDLRAKVATLKIDFDIAVAKSITAGGGDQQCWSLLFSGKQRDGIADIENVAGGGHGESSTLGWRKPSFPIPLPA